LDKSNYKVSSGVVPGIVLEGREFGGRKELIPGIGPRTLLSGDGVGEVVVKLGS